MGGAGDFTPRPTGDKTGATPPAGTFENVGDDAGEETGEAVANL